MKKIKLFWMLSWMVWTNLLLAQDSLTVQNLDSLTYEFNIIDGKLVGAGADFLIKEINNAQFTLLGDMPQSKNCADLTTALIPELNKANYKTMVLGIGSISNQMLGKLSHQPKAFLQQHRLLNDKYALKDKGKTHIPISELGNVEEANYYAKALAHDWSIIGVGRETWAGLPMLIDFMYKNLTKDLQIKHKTSYENCLTSLQKISNNRNGDPSKFYTEVRNAKPINDFLIISSHEKKNEEALLEFEYCMQYILMYVEKVYFKKNQIRVQNEKDKLKRQAEAMKIDWAKDKIFVKWDHGYIPKGVQSNPVYGLGSTMHELATFHGNQSLHIGVLKRFHMKDGVLYDELESKYQWIREQDDFIQMGEKSEWVVIDVRPLLQGLYYYPTKYLVNKRIGKMIDGYDLIIIPKTEYEATPNFRKK